MRTDPVAEAHARAAVRETKGGSREAVVLVSAGHSRAESSVSIRVGVFVFVWCKPVLAEDVAEQLCRVAGAAACSRVVRAVRSTRPLRVGTLVAGRASPPCVCVV